MKALILAAGFGTRLRDSLINYTGPHIEEVTYWAENKPKGLVLVKGKPLVTYLLEQIKNAGIEKEDVYVQTNNLYYNQYLDWANKSGIPEDNVINNKIDYEQNRLGPNRDLKFALDKKIGCDVPLLVVASDTLIYDDKGKFYDFSNLTKRYNSDGLSRIIVHDYRGEKLKLSQHGIVEVNNDGVVVNFEECPDEPKSNLICTSVYVYSPKVLQLIRDKFNNVDEKKHILEEICSLEMIKAEIVSQRMDITNISDLIKVNNLGD